MALNETLLNSFATRGDIARLNLQLRQLDMIVRLAVNMVHVGKLDTTQTAQIYQALDNLQNELNADFRALTGWTPDA